MSGNVRVCQPKFERNLPDPIARLDAVKQLTGAHANQRNYPVRSREVWRDCLRVGVDQTFEVAGEYFSLQSPAQVAKTPNDTDTPVLAVTSVSH